MTGMFDVSRKIDTFRMATAQAIIRISQTTMQRLDNGNSPKGNIVEAAKISGTLAAKKTSDLIPYCHQIPIDNVNIDVSLFKNQIKVIVQVKSIWKTGVEMEALTSACIASLTIYDMLKPIDEFLSIESVKLIRKKGGINDFKERSHGKITAAVLVASDTRSKQEDESGKIIIEKLIEIRCDIVEYEVTPDDKSTIISKLKKFSDDLRIDMVITTGGTGIGPRDATPEATKEILEKELSGVAETIRAHGQRRTPLSMLSRGIAGIRGNTVIINLPGSTTAVSESLDCIFPGILHVFKIMHGHKHE
jgi:molybdenum cofactor biosynthesis protein MoaC